MFINEDSEITKRFYGHIMQKIKYFILVTISREISEYYKVEYYYFDPMIT